MFHKPHSLSRRIVVNIALAIAATLAVASCDTPVRAADAQGKLQVLETTYARIQIDNKGCITSLVATATSKEYSPASHPSPLVCLHEHGQPNDTLLAPSSAVSRSDGKEIELTYSNGSVALVKVEAKDGYCRFELVSLTQRKNVDNIVWGPVNTTISGVLGQIIGVVRSDDFAIGLFGLDDNTIAGPVTDGDCFSMGYYIHSADPVKNPLPAEYKEGQLFNIGGDGVNDVAFFSCGEEFFQWIGGNGAQLKPEFGSRVVYHARDRRRSYVHNYSLLPGFERSRPRHMVSDPVPGVDYIGSAVALYACPDDQGIATLERIFKAEGLPYITDRDGKWIRDPASYRPTIYWNGPVDKAIEYTKALGFKDISRDTGEYYSHRHGGFQGTVGFSDGTTLTYKEYAEQCHKQGLTHGGLHAMCLFLNGSNPDVTPVPSKQLQTVCRTRLAKDISATDTEIVVTDPAFLAERGTWTCGDGSNYLRVNDEMMSYESISDSAPWTLKGVKRGHASKAEAHKAGDELNKLMQNCYNGFVPDIELMLDYADGYVNIMVNNGMDTINFDGYESLMYQNHGYYAMKRFNRRLFEGYHAKTGKWPRVTGSNVFAGAWEYMNVCDLGSGNHMFNPASGRLGIEGKDIGNVFRASYFPATFGIQAWTSVPYDAQNLQAKAIGWDATFALVVSQNEIELSGAREAIFAAFRAWQKAREAQVFSKEHKALLRDPDFKFDLAQGPDETSFVLTQIKELRAAGDVPQTPVILDNTCGEQPLEFALRLNASPEVLAKGLTVILPDGREVKVAQAIPPDAFLICKGDALYLANPYRMKIADVMKLVGPAVLPAGKASFALRVDGWVKYDLTVYAVVKREKIGK